MDEGPQLALPVELQCVVQTFLSQNALAEVNLRALLARVLDKTEGETSREVINENINKINEVLNHLSFEIRRTIQQKDGTTIWVFCNTVSDQFTQIATAHTPSEIAFFKGILDLIFVKNNTYRAEVLAVSSIDAIRSAQEAGLTRAQAQSALDSFVEETWLQLSSGGYYTITARTLAELQGYLVDQYNEPEDGLEGFKSCYACKEYIIMGYRCPDLGCPCRLHFKCYNTFFQSRMKLCPMDSAQSWETEDVLYMGEKAAVRREASHDSDNDDDMVTE